MLLDKQQQEQLQDQEVELVKKFLFFNEYLFIKIKYYGIEKNICYANSNNYYKLNCYTYFFIFI